MPTVGILYSYEKESAVAILLIQMSIWDYYCPKEMNKPMACELTDARTHRWRGGMEEPP